MTDTYFLSKGQHESPDDGRCAMEWVSYLAGEPHSDSPQCVSPVLARFCIAFNDGLDDDRRQRLRPYLARTIGTRGDGLDEQRSWMALDWLIRTYTPMWLSLAGLDDAAGRLRALPPVLAVENLQRAMGDLHSARSEAVAAWEAAGATAGDVAGVAAGVAARVAAGDAAGDAARAAARAAARVAAWNAAGVAAGVAARVAAWAALKSTVLVLQESAFELLDRMLPTEMLQLPVASEWKEVCGVVC